MIDGFAKLLPRPSTEDIFAGRVRVDLGGVTYTLPVRSRKANREWRESLDEQFVSMLRTVESLDSMPQILGLLIGASDKLLDALISYDATGVLPPRDDIDAQASEIEIVKAILGVWMMANPLVAIGLALTADVEPEMPSPTSSPTPLGPTAGPRRSSKKNSPTPN
jgi:hypothetical protein